jgi:polyhydroxybutyrate depolymerase
VTTSGEQRTARLVVPASYDASTHVPLVLVFHGYTEDAADIENISEMTPVAEQHGFVVAYPQGKSNSWNAGKCCGTASSSQSPDVAFVSDLIDALSQEICIDPKRVYAAGFSNGGMLSNRLACELSDRIAAFAPVAGPRAIDQCQPTRPIPMIEFHGTSDFVVPYNGNGLGGAISVQANVDYWKDNAGCTDSAAISYQNGDTTCVQHTQCDAGATIRLCTVDGGGHQWPGGQSAGALGGKLTQDIDASAEMAAFFLAHPMP